PSEQKVTPKKSIPSSEKAAMPVHSVNAEKQVEKTREVKASAEKDMQKNTHVTQSTPPAAAEQKKVVQPFVKSMTPQASSFKKEKESGVVSAAEIVAQPMTVDQISQKLHRPVNEVIVALI